MPSPSANATVISSYSDPPIVDALGVVWRITPDGLVMANNVLDKDRVKVRHLAYVNGSIARQTVDLIWSQKHVAEQTWAPSPPPLPGVTAQQTGDIESALAQILAQVNAISAEVAANTAAVDATAADVAAATAAQAASNEQVVASVAAVKADLDAAIKSMTVTAQQIQSSITAFRADMDSRENALSALISSLSAQIATQILSSQQTLLANIDAVPAAVIKLLNTPTRIAADLNQALHEPQAIPPHG